MSPFRVQKPVFVLHPGILLSTTKKQNKRSAKTSFCTKLKLTPHSGNSNGSKTAHPPPYIYRQQPLLYKQCNLPKKTLAEIKQNKRPPAAHPKTKLCRKKLAAKRLGHTR